MLRLRTQVSVCTALDTSFDILMVGASVSHPAPVIIVPCHFCGLEASSEDRKGGKGIPNKVAADAPGREEVLKEARRLRPQMYACEPEERTGNERCCGACSAVIGKVHWEPPRASCDAVTGEGRQGASLAWSSGDCSEDSSDWDAKSCCNTES